MCGIVGAFTPSGNLPVSVIDHMNSALIHRGPDGQGSFIHGPAALAMRRLAVIDLATGNQPIFNEDRSVAVVLNGEIYNYRELSAELKAHGHQFASESDTEVLVHGYEDWGDELPCRLNGMFAFALYDLKRERLLVARDHLGIKPLYYAELDNGVAFASEIKALRPLMTWDRSIDPVALDWYLATRYIPAPYSIFQGVRKLPPAHLLSIGVREPLRLQRYWDVTFAAQDGRTKAEWSTGLRERLTTAIRRQMVADVPIGAFLSGGLDSSIVVGVMAQASARPVHTFTVKFPGWSQYDESPYAQAVADHFGSLHTEIAVEADVATAWPKLVAALDEPFADPATLPTWLMANATRRNVTVVLTGEGADELFAGYGWYGWRRPWPLPAAMVGATRAIVSRLLDGQRGRHRLLASVAPDFATFYGDSILSSALTSLERNRIYQRDWLGHLQERSMVADLHTLSASTATAHWQSRIQEHDLKIWLEGDPLVKADRATMLASLEARVPFLDVDVVEWAASIPPHLQREGGVAKSLLRHAFDDLLPDIVKSRSKHAFDVPIASWLRGPLKPMLSAALTDESPLWTCLQPTIVRKMAAAHWQGASDYSRQLWVILHLAYWWDTNAA